MTKFDPDRHRIVAVVTDRNDPEFGQHFHLSLPDLVQEVREIETQIRPPEIVDRISALEAAPRDVPAEIIEKIAELEAREPTREVVKVEAIPADLRREWESFKSSQEYVLPHAFKELIERVAKLESEPRDITPAVPAGYDSLVERVEMVEEHSVAGAELYEAMANAMRLVSDLKNTMERNKARADGQHGMVVDELSHLAGVIRRAS